MVLCLLFRIKMKRTNYKIAKNESNKAEKWNIDSKIRLERAKNIQKSIDTFQL